MELIWKISDSDVLKVVNVIKTNRDKKVERIINHNIKHIDVEIDKDSILRAMLICLLSSDSEPYPEEKTDQLFNKKPYLLNYQYLLRAGNIEEQLYEIFQAGGLTKYAKKIPGLYASNVEYLTDSNWELEHEIREMAGKDLSVQEERKLADMTDRSFKGFGSKEARSFLLALGVTRYEIPVDFQMIRWLEQMSFPVRFSGHALQDIYFYHFISDGIQKLCEISDTFPCLLYSSVITSYSPVK